MKQVLQSLKTGETRVDEIPCPSVQSGSLLIRSTRTLISPGTERMLIDFGKASFIGKARQQPDRVKQVIEKMRTDGLKPTLDAVFNKLDQPLPLGYCNVGTVMEANGVVGLSQGDRVVSNGKHAEVVCVPKNLCAKVPNSVSDEEASFTVLGAIALQGIRLAEPTLGETFAVMGLGLVGLLTVQLLRANGCRVIGMDFDKNKLELAKTYGAETIDLSAGVDPVAIAMQFSRDRGVDGVLITAATSSSEPVHQAAVMCRKRGRIVLVGVTGLELSRADFFEKELTFQVSCSYGPGRYDQNYEEGGQDYPIGFVRWTEQRNLEAVLDMMASKRLDVSSLVSHRFTIDDADRAYELVSGQDNKSALGIVLSYPQRSEKTDAELRLPTVQLTSPDTTVAATNRVKVGFIGAGNYASAVLVPAMQAAGAILGTVISNTGVSGAHTGKKHGFAKTGTDAGEAIADPDLNAIVIATRHDSHSELVVDAIKAGKHVFVEKPLAITLEQLAMVEEAHAKALETGDAPLVMVGFNRRFAPQINKIKTLLSATSAPKSMTMTVNAGFIPSNHWTQDTDIGGGRIVGEACHFIDLLRYLTGSKITDHSISYMNSVNGDTATISLQFADGSIGSIHYFSNGPKSLPKERLEVFLEGRVLQLNNFRKLRGYGWSGFRKMNLWQQDKGQRRCAAAFVDAIKNGDTSPIGFDELVEVSRVSIELAGQRL